METPEDNFGRRLRREREERGWTQAELAQKLAEKGLSIHPSSIAKIELRDVERPRNVRLDEASAIAAVLGVTLDELLRPSDDVEKLAVHLWKLASIVRDDLDAIDDFVDEIAAIVGAMPQEEAAKARGLYALDDVYELAAKLPHHELSVWISRLRHPSRPISRLLRDADREDERG